MTNHYINVTVQTVVTTYHQFKADEPNIEQQAAIQHQMRVGRAKFYVEEERTIKVGNPFVPSDY